MEGALRRCCRMASGENEPSAMWLLNSSKMFRRPADALVEEQTGMAGGEPGGSPPPFGGVLARSVLQVDLDVPAAEHDLVACRAWQDSRDGPRLIEVARRGPNPDGVTILRGRRPGAWLGLVDDVDLEVLLVPDQAGVDGVRHARLLVDGLDVRLPAEGRRARRRRCASRRSGRCHGLVQERHGVALHDEVVRPTVVRRANDTEGPEVGRGPVEEQTVSL